ncbi:MAG: hypothetical protein ACPGU1_13055 [Myxococcota bacterium]
MSTVNRQWRLPLSVLVLLAVAAPACKDVIEDRVVHRSSCLVCHQPLDDEGVPHGIGEAHPWHPLSCTDCHGGNDRVCDGVKVVENGETTCDGEWVYDMELAHVGPGTGPKYLKNLSAAELDEVDEAYVRFINPGDFRVLDKTCQPCHPKQTEAVMRSTMAHTSGEVTVARYRAMKQATPYGLLGVTDVHDPNSHEASECAVPELQRMEPAPIDITSDDPHNAPTVANAQDQYMVKSCFRCHLSDFGENRFPGDFRSSGCTACHMPYSDDGLYIGTDPWVNRQTVPHPVTHQMTKSPPYEACTSCHYRGGRLGINFQGYREGGGPGYNPDNPAVLGKTLHGHDANFYMTDEDIANDWDETPADVHFEAGMHCIDCHTTEDVHGDGHIYADTQCANRTQCESCHGSVRERAELDPLRDNIYERDGTLFLLTRVTGIELEIPQTMDTVTKGHKDYNPLAEQSMGINEDGFSHTDELECYTCHASWTPSCYGCHVEIDLTKDAAYHTTGEMVPGRPVGGRKWVTLNDMVLMRNTEGKMGLSMPAERFFMTLVGPGEEEGESEDIFTSKPRTFTFDDGRTIAGFGQRTFNPHTTRRTSQFMACDRCHTQGDPEAPDNATLLDLTYGFGTQRFMEEACDVTNEDESCDPETDWTTYALDAIQTREGLPLVVPGHPFPQEMRPLSLDEIARMRAVQVPQSPPFSTEIPEDAATDPWWPRNQRMGDNIYTPEELDLLRNPPTTIPVEPSGP